MMDPNMFQRMAAQRELLVATPHMSGPTMHPTIVVEQRFDRVELLVAQFALRADVFAQQHFLWIVVIGFYIERSVSATGHYLFHLVVALDDVLFNCNGCVHNC